MIPNDDILLNDHPTYNRNNKKYQDHQQIETPDYFDMITEEDQIAYRKMMKMIGNVQSSVDFFISTKMIN